MTVIDQQERLQALDPNQSFIIQAPAGSGKTELLTQRILALMPTVKKPEEILAITFTNKAAAEMRARVLQKLTHPKDDLARAALEHIQRHNWRLLEFPSRLNIRTIDAFCGQLVRSTPFASGAGSNPQQTEYAQELFQEAAEMALERNQAHTIALLEHLDNQWDMAVGLIAKMLEKRDQWLDLLGDEQYLEKMILLYAPLIRETVMPFMPILKQLDFVRLHRYIQFSISCFQVMNGLDKKLVWHDLADWQGEPLIPYDEKSGMVSFEMIHRLKLCKAFLTTTQNGIRKTLTKNHGFPSDKDFKNLFPGQINLKTECETYLKEELVHIPHIDDLIQMIDILPSRLPSVESLEIIHDLLMVLSDAKDALQNVFRNRSAVDFQEISLRAVHALGNCESPSDLLLKKDNQIRHILIDEFQDTSYSQMQLLHLLISGWQSQDGRTLFLVGDPMQSIYRFRKAEVGLFLTIWENKKVAHLPITPLSLQVNFRSDKGVIDWVNQSFSHIFPQENQVIHGAIQYSPSTAFHVAEQEGIEAVQWHLFHSADAETQVVEDLIATCRHALAQYRTSDKPAIAILVRSRSHIVSLLPHLKAAQIPFNCVELIPLKSQMEVMDLVQLIRAMSLPHDRLAWASLLRSPLCGLKLSSLAYLLDSEWNKNAHLPVLQLLENYLSETPNDSFGLSERERKQLKYLTDLMLAQQLTTSTLPFSAQIADLWRALGGDKVYSQTHEKENIRTILEIVDGLAPYGVLDVFELDKAIERLNANASSQSPAVEIMTMHKSKGLEFNEVILFDLNRKPPEDSKQLMHSETVYENGQHKGILLSPIKHSFEDQDDPYTTFIRHSDKQRALYEAQRLLYVAATRAKKVLHLFAEKTDKVQSGSLWQYLVDVFPNQQAPKPEALLISDDQSAESSQRMYPISLPEEKPAKYTVLKEEVLNELIQTYQKDLQGVSPFSRMVRQSDTSSDQYREKVERRAAHFGELFHQVMEYIARDRDHHWHRDEVAKLKPVLKKIIARRGLDAGQVLEPLVQLVCQALEHHELSKYLRYADRRPEWVLYDANNDKHIIDLVVDTGTDEGLVLIDYKTSAKHDGQTVEAFKQSLVDQHQKQIARYYGLLRTLYGENHPIKAYLYATSINELIPVR